MTTNIPPKRRQRRRRAWHNRSTRDEIRPPVGVLEAAARDCRVHRQPVPLAAYPVRWRFLPHQTVSLRRQRRATALSCDRMTKPSGTIQKPRIGRKPRQPPPISRTPTDIRASRDFGSGTRSEPSINFPLRWSMPKRFVFLGLLSAVGGGWTLAWFIHRKWEHRQLLQANDRFLKKPLGKSGKHLY